MNIDEIRGAVARGWCSRGNEYKEMDVDLAEGISKEVAILFREFKEPQLGCATTEELLDEIKARIALSCELNYRTINAN